MTWVKLPDDALDDPKVADVAPEDIVAYLRTLGWSNRWARDGLIPRATAGAPAAAWIAAGLAEEADDGICLRWLLEYQPKSDEIERRKRDAADRQERHRRHMAGDHSKCDPKRCHTLLKREPVTRDKTRDKRTLRSDSAPSLPEGRGEERADDDTGNPSGPVVVPNQRRQLARAIREAPNPMLKRRFLNRFVKDFGHLYSHEVAA